MRNWLDRAVRGPLEATTWRGLGAATALMVLLLVAGAFVQPPFEVPDERFHFDLVTAVMEGGGFPSPDSRSLTGDTLAAGRLLGRERTTETDLPGGTSFQQEPPACDGGPLPACTRSPRLEELEAYVGVFTEDQPSSMTQHPPLFYALTGGAAVVLTGLAPFPVPIDLLVFVLRMLSMVWLVALPLLLLGVTRQFGASEPTALFASVMSLFPASLLTRVGPMINNDALAIVLAAAMTLVAAMAALQAPTSRRLQVALGVLAGLGSLAKGLLLAFPALVVMVPLWGLWRGTIDRRGALRQVGLGSLAWLLSGGWWLVRNLVEFGTLQPLVPRGIGSSDSATNAADWASQWVTGTARTFFGNWMPWTESPLLWLVVAAIVVAMVLGVRRLSPPRRSLVLLLALPPTATVAGVLVGSWDVFADYGVIKAAQGRYLLMGLSLMAMLLAIGSAGRMATRRERVVAVAVVVAVAFMQIDNFLERLGAWGDDLSLLDQVAVARDWSPLGTTTFDLWMIATAVLGLYLFAVVGRTLLAFPTPVHGAVSKPLVATDAAADGNGSPNPESSTVPRSSAVSALLRDMRPWDRRVVALATIAFAFFASMHALLVPIHRGGDETQHHDMVMEVYEDHAWSWPEDAWIDPAIRRSKGLNLWSLKWQRREVQEAVPRAERPTWNEVEQAVRDDNEERGGNNHIAQHPFLYYAAVAPAWGVAQSARLGLAHDQALLALRLASELLMLVVPLLTWLTARRLGADRLTSRAAAVLSVGIPDMVHVAGTVQNDNLATPLGFAFLFILAGILQGRRDLRTAASLGLVTGASLLTKGFALLWPPLIVGVYLWSCRHRLRAAVRPMMVSLAVAAITGGWWWVRNLVVKGVLQPNPLFANRDVPGPPDMMGPWWHGFMLRFVDGFWGRFGELDAEFPRWLTISLWVALLVLVGRGLVLWQRDRSPGRAGLVDMVLLGGLTSGLSAVLIYQSLSAYLRYGYVAGMQGRYLYSGVSVVFVLVATAIAGRIRRRLLPIAWLTVAVLQSIGLFVALQSWYGPREGPWSLAAGLRSWAAWVAWPPEVVALVVGTAVVGSVLLVLWWTRDSAPPASAATVPAPDAEPAKA